MQPMIVEGVVKADGTLEINERLKLPPGKVEVIVRRMPELPLDDPFWQHMQKIWDALDADGHEPSTHEEIEEERMSIRKAPDEHAEELEQQQQTWYEEQKRAGL